MRENNNSDISELKKIYNLVKQEFPNDWLLSYEILEIINALIPWAGQCRQPGNLLCNRND